MSQAGQAGGSNPPPASDVSMRPYIVGPTNSDYKTISAAIAAAVAAGASSSAPANILVKPNGGPYIENLTLSDGIQIYVNSTASSLFFTQVQRQVTLQGSVTLSSGKASISGVDISPTSGNGIIISGGTLDVAFCSCNTFGGSTFISFTGTSGTTNLNLNNNTFYGLEAGNPTWLTTAGNGGTLSLADTNSVVNFINSPVVLASGDSITWNALQCSYTFIITANATSFTGVFYKCILEGFELGETFLTVSSDTAGSCSFPHSQFSAFDNSFPLFSIANASFIIDVPICIFDQPYTLTLADGQQQRANLYIVQGSGESEEGFVFTDYKNGFTGSRYVQKQNFIQTTDATNQILLEIPVAAGSAVVAQGIVNGTKSDWSDSQGGNFVFQASRESAGNVTIVGSNVIQVSGSAATFFCTVDTGTQTMRVIVNGVASTTYNWGSTYQYMAMINNN